MGRSTTGLLAALLFVCSCASSRAYAQAPEEGDAAATAPADRPSKLPQGAYVSIDPLSLTAFIPSTFTKEQLPYAYDLDSGVSVAGGYYYPSGVDLEGRVVLGSPAALIFCPQIHAGVRYFPFRRVPVGVGLFLRTWDTWYTNSGTHFVNASLHPNVSYVVKVKRILLDFRAGWDPVRLTVSSLAHSRPAAGYTRMPPTLSVDIGYNF